jgi:hypothetical protein
LYDVGTASASDEANNELLKLLSIDGKPIGSLRAHNGNIVVVASDSDESPSLTSPYYVAYWASGTSGLNVAFKFPGAEEKTIEYGVEDFDISEEEFPNLRNKIFAMLQPVGDELELDNADDSDATSFDTSESGSRTRRYATLDGEVDATGYEIVWHPGDSAYTYELFIPDATSLANMREIGFFEDEDKVAIMSITGNIA